MAEKGTKTLAYPALTKYNKFIPDASPGCGTYLIYLYIFETSPSAKLFTDTISPTLFIT